MRTAALIFALGTLGRAQPSRCCRKPRCHAHRNGVPDGAYGQSKPPAGRGSIVMIADGGRQSGLTIRLLPIPAAIFDGKPDLALSAVTNYICARPLKALLSGDSPSAEDGPRGEARSAIRACSTWAAPRP